MATALMAAPGRISPSLQHLWTPASICGRPPPSSCSCSLGWGASGKRGHMVPDAGPG